MSRSSRIAAACLLALSCGACKSDDQHWSFALTRSVWGNDTVYDPGAAVCSVPVRGEGSDAAIGLAVFLLAPTAIDLVLLPITLTHDVWFLE